MRVLIVDDSDFSRLTYKRFFTEINDLEIAEANNGIEALEQHRSFHPDIIFLDITMPHLDGLATLKTIRIIDKNVIVIMATALGGQNQICQECTALGADTILTKPITKDAALKALLAAAYQYQSQGVERI